MTINEYNNIISYLRGIIEGSEFEGHVFSVGGCERDKRISHKIKDIDLVVDTLNGGIKFSEWLNNRNLLVSAPVVFKEYGTAAFKLKAFPNEELEAVQTRKESYRDTQSRNPETVHGTIMEDCMRRDFTINSLYHNITTDEDLDLTGKGLEDLKNGVIRSCDDPDIIFYEDPLRIMRAIRFSMRYQFLIEDTTYEGIIKHKARLSIISMERIVDEFNKIIVTEDYQFSAYKTLLDTGILEEIFCNILKAPINIDSITTHMLNNVRTRTESLYREKDDVRLLSFLAAFSSYISDWDIVYKKMKYSNDIIRDIKKLRAARFEIKKLSDLHNNKVVLRKAQYICGEKLWSSFLSLMAYYTPIRHPHRLSSYPAMFGYELPVDGNDVMSICGIVAGKEVKEKLDELMELAFKNPSISYKECEDYLKGKRSFWQKIKNIWS